MTASGSPRADVRDMIADVLGILEPCRHERYGTCHSCAAVQVMGLFPIVGSERLMVVDDEPYVLPGEVRATHRRYVLRTEPELIEGDNHAD